MKTPGNLSLYIHGDLISFYGLEAGLIPCFPEENVFWSHGEGKEHHLNDSRKDTMGGNEQR